MKLKSLNIQLGASYSDNPGKYLASVEYEDLKCSHQLVLSPELSDKIMVFIGPVITAATTKLAKDLEASLQESITEANRNQLVEISES